MTAAELLSVPDLLQIQSAIGAVTYADDISWTRNAIVHNSPAAFSRYERMALEKYLVRDIMPYRLPLETNAVTGNSIYEDWCDELKTALQLAL